MTDPDRADRTYGCREDYVKVNDEHGGVWTFCGTCPRLPAVPLSRPGNQTGGESDG